MIDKRQVFNPVTSLFVVLSCPGSVCGGTAAEGPEGLDQPAVPQHPDCWTPGSPIWTVEGAKWDWRCECHHNIPFEITAQRYLLLLTITSFYWDICVLLRECARRWRMMKWRRNSQRSLLWEMKINTTTAILLERYTHVKFSLIICCGPGFSYKHVTLLNT